MRAITNLSTGDLDAVIPIATEHCIAKSPRAVRVGALADGQVGGVLSERHGLVKRGNRCLGLNRALDHLLTANRLDDGFEVFWGRTAAAAHQTESVITSECHMRLGHFLSAQWVMSAIGGQNGEACVGHRTDTDARRLRQSAQVLAHLGGTGGAVQADHLNAQGLEGCQRRADLRSQKHRAGGLDRDLSQHR